jgi:hypothetical protein
MTGILFNSANLIFAPILSGLSSILTRKPLFLNFSSIARAYLLIFSDTGKIVTCIGASHKGKSPP